MGESMENKFCNHCKKFIECSCGKNILTKSVAQAAEDLVHGDRMEEYGHPTQNFMRIAKLWSGYLNVDVTAEDVAMMMVLFKVSRQKAKNKRDNIVDGIGYFINAARVRGLE